MSCKTPSFYRVYNLMKLKPQKESNFKFWNMATSHENWQLHIVCVTFKVLFRTLWCSSQPHSLTVLSVFSCSWNLYMACLLSYENDLELCLFCMLSSSIINFVDWPISKMIEILVRHNSFQNCLHKTQYSLLCCSQRASRWEAHFKTEAFLLKLEVLRLYEACSCVGDKPLIIGTIL